MSDEGGWRRYSRRGALGLMGVGGGLVVTETLGVTDVTRGRGVNVGVAEDTDALLRVVAQETGEALDGETDYGAPLTIEFENQSNFEITNIDITIDPDGGLKVADSVDRIESGKDKTVDINLDDETEATGDITIEATIDSSESVRLTREDITVKQKLDEFNAENQTVTQDDDEDLELEIDSAVDAESDDFEADNIEVSVNVQDLDGADDAGVDESVEVDVDFTDGEAGPVKLLEAGTVDDLDAQDNTTLTATVSGDDATDEDTEDEFDVTVNEN